ncbi:hypothetical protein Tco_0013770 [Tanacetum coccineum]
MDDPNMTMEEYIKLEEEKAHRRGRVFNWQTDTYEKIMVSDDLYDLRSVEAEFPAIVIDDAFAPKDTLPLKSQVSTPVNDKIDFRISFKESDDEVYHDDLKSDKDNDKINIEHSLGDLSVKPLPDVINIDVGAYAHDLMNEKSTNIGGEFLNLEDLEVLES